MLEAASIDSKWINTTYEDSAVHLVPYLPEHVPRYHAWMQDTYLLATTASERLTLEQEYTMQETWRIDPEKHTFIILDKSLTCLQHLQSTTNRGKMAGDVNIFLLPNLGDNVGELEIMIAEQASRRKGLATRALQVYPSLS